MDERLEKLKALGCDVDAALARFMGDEQLYFTCFESLKSDENFEKLGDALGKSDAKGAFHYAHMLKGVYANMGMTPIYNDCVAIVEPLRSGSCPDRVLENYRSMQMFMQTIKTI